MKNIIAIMALFALASCQSDYEALERLQDMQIKANYKQTYNPITLKGPLKIENGGSITSTVPSMPYEHTPIPNGQAYQVDMAGKVLNTAGILGAGFLLKRAGDGGSTTKIYNSNGGAKP